jgi:hypothetical protein
VRKATGVGKTAVCEYVDRAKVIGITWPIAPEIDDAELERLLFTPAGFHEGPTKSLLSSATRPPCICSRPASRSTSYADGSVTSASTRPERVEAAAQRGNDIRATTYGSIKSILQNGLDRAFAKPTMPDTSPIRHANIRGRGYYH